MRIDAHRYLSPDNGVYVKNEMRVLVLAAQPPLECCVSYIFDFLERQSQHHLSHANLEVRASSHTQNWKLVTA